MKYEDLPRWETTSVQPTPWKLDPAGSIVWFKDLPQKISVSEELPPLFVLVCVYYEGDMARPSHVQYGYRCERGSAKWWESDNGADIAAPSHWRHILR